MIADPLDELVDDEAPPAESTILDQVVSMAQLQAAAHRHQLDVQRIETGDGSYFLQFRCPSCLAAGNANSWADAKIDLEFDGFTYRCDQGCYPVQIVTELLAEPGPGPPVDEPERLIVGEKWSTFRDASQEDVPFLVDGIWPAVGIGFIAAPPKAGKTWLALELAVAVALGEPFLHAYPSTPSPVLYIALEGHKAAIRARIGCIARGHGIDPNSEELDRLEIVYKPRGIELIDETWAAHLIAYAREIGAKLIIIDVLRAAATIRESGDGSGDFKRLRDNFAPIADEANLCLLHHFTKLSETSQQRTPAERMAGSGSLYGALDVALLITGSEKGARKLRLHHELRDGSTIHEIGAELHGEGSGKNGGFTFMDTLAVRTTDTPPSEDTLKAPSSEIAGWIAQQPNVRATPSEIREQFCITNKTLRTRIYSLEQEGVLRIGEGRLTRYVCSSPIYSAAWTDDDRAQIEGL